MSINQDGVEALAAGVRAQNEGTEQQSRSEWLFQFLEAVPVGVFVLNRHGQPFYANAIAQEMLGKGIVPDIDTHNLATTYQTYVSGTDEIYPSERMPIVRALAGERTEVDDMEIRRPDRNLLLEVSATPIYDAAGKVAYALASFTDVTRRKEAEEALVNLSIRDPLTGVFNRRYLEETLDRELYRAARQRNSVGVVMADIDHFKGFNDRFGHAIGDAVLQGVAAQLKRGVRAEDVVCRYGGEEFTLLLPGAVLAITIGRAEQLRSAIGSMELPELLGRDTAITMSFGVAVYPQHGGSTSELLAAADAALYTAKAQGRNQVISAGAKEGHSPE